MAWGQSIAQGIGQTGADFGSAVDANVFQTLNIIQNKLLQQEVQSRLREQEQRMKQMQQPVFEGTYQTPQGILALSRDPNSGKISGSIVPGSQTTAPSVPPQLSDENLSKIVGNLPPQERETAMAQLQLSRIIGQTTGDYSKAISTLGQLVTKEGAKPSAASENWKQAQEIAAALPGGAPVGTSANVKKALEIYKPAGAKIALNLGGANALPGIPSIPSAGGGGGVGAVDSNPQFSALQSRDPQLASLVKQIADYKINPQTLSNRGGHREKILGIVSMIDPTYDQTQFTSRAALRRDFNSGKAANNIRSLNTAISHLHKFYQAGLALNNSPFTPWNIIANYGLEKTGDKRVDQFNAAANAVEGEMATVFKGTAGTDQEIKQWRMRLNSSKSPAQIQGLTQELVILMAGRLQALDDQWTRGMGKPRDFRILSDTSQKILKGMGMSMEDESATPSTQDLINKLPFNPIPSH